MSKREAADVLEEIESSYNVKSITYNNIPLWPILRVYIGSQLHFEKDRTVRLNTQNALSGIRYFFRGVKYLFTRFDYLSFTSSDQRKRIEGKMLDRSDFISKDFGRGLTVETPMSKHFSRDMYDGPMTSHMFMYAIEFLMVKLMSSKIRRFNNLDVLQRIEKDFNVSVNPIFLTKRFRAQFKLISVLNQIWKTKFVITTTAYMRYGYVYYFKMNDIPVIELQHGVINTSHNAYNVYTEIDPNFYPDYLLTFGENEREVFKESMYIAFEKTIAAGSFYIDHMSNLTLDNTIQKKYKQYDRYVAVVLQDMFDEQLFEFMEKGFKQLEKTLFVLIPRNKNSEYYKSKFELLENMVFEESLNTYEIIKMCDIHTTINSTTAIEAPSLGTPNVFVNVDGLSRQYFENTLKNRKVNHFSDTIEDYISVVESYMKCDSLEVKKSNEDIFKQGFSTNLNTALKIMYGDIEK